LCAGTSGHQRWIISEGQLKRPRKDLAGNQNLAIYIINNNINTMNFFQEANAMLVTCFHFHMLPHNSYFPSFQGALKAADSRPASVCAGIDFDAIVCWTKAPTPPGHNCRLKP
jgi:hypothetical protein